MVNRSRGEELTRWNGRSNWTSEMDCFWSVIWICWMGSAFCLQNVVPGAGERAVVGVEVDVGVDGGDLGLGETLKFLEVLFVLGLEVAELFLGIEGC